MSSNERHPTTEVLLKTLDGELSPSELKAVRSHLKACWKCRKESIDIENTVHAYTALTSRLTSPERLNPPNSFASFHSKLTLLDSQSRTRKGHQYRRLLKDLFWGRVAFRFQIALLLLGVFLFSTRFENVQAVSASELLSRASGRENAAQTTGDAAVIFQKVSFRLNRKSFTRGAYRDMVHRRQIPPRFAAAADLAKGDALNGEVSKCREMMDKAELNFEEPLSPTGFEAWLRSRKHGHRELVVQIQDRLRLTSEIEGGPIHSAELVLRQTDYHAVEERFEFADHQELDITELAYEVRQPQFRELALADGSEHTARTGLRLLKRRDFQAEAEQQDKRQREEMQARVILHRSGADLGEQVSIEKVGNDLTLTGIVEGSERKKDLVEAFRDANGIRIQLQTFAEATAELPIRSARGAVIDDKAQVGAPILASAIKEAFDTDEHRQEYVRQLLSFSDQTRSHAFALRKLAQRYPPESVAKLPADCQQQLRELVQEHLQAFQDEQEQLRQLVTRFVDAPPDRTPGGSLLAWQPQAFRLIEVLQREQNDLVALFVGQQTAERAETETELDLKNILRDDVIRLIPRMQ